MAAVIVTKDNAVAIADGISDAFKAGTITHVQGRELVSRFGSPVGHSWQNGSVSFTVKGRAKGKIADVFVKAGQALHV